MIVLQALLMLGVRAADIRVYPLDERSVYTIRLGREEPTTCAFPAPLKAIVGANVSASVDDDPGILLSHAPGTEYFSLRRLKDGANGALNVMLRGKVYALAFVAADEPDRAVIFLDEPLADGRTRVPEPGTLQALLERTKQQGREVAARPGMSPALETAKPGTVTLYRNFRATIELIVRFETEDALVFRIRLENPTDRAVPYDPAGLAVRLDREFFPAALAEASGAIPAQGTGLVYLVITGSPGGGRANLPVRGHYHVIIPHP